MRVPALVCATALAGSLLTLAPLTRTVAAQGRCFHAPGTPACNTQPVPPPFAATGWKTTALEQITFRVANPQAESAFYAAVMGWTVRTSGTDHIVMDVGDWGKIGRAHV